MTSFWPAGGVNAEAHPFGSKLEKLGSESNFALLRGVQEAEKVLAQARSRRERINRIILDLDPIGREYFVIALKVHLESAT
jgi:hypothetical protein